jgi:hypothetical protein
MSERTSARIPKKPVTASAVEATDPSTGEGTSSSAQRPSDRPIRELTESWGVLKIEDREKAKLAAKEEFAG